MPFDVYHPTTALGSRLRSMLALALLAATVSAAAATQGRVGVGSTASIGIRFEVVPAIHGQSMSLSALGDNALPSSLARYLCLTLIDVAGVTLGMPAPGHPVSRLTPVDFRIDPHPACAGQSLRYSLPAHDGTVPQGPTLVIVQPI